MEILEEIRHQVAICGRVTGDAKGAAMAGARVEISSAPTGFSAWLALRALCHGTDWDSLTERPDRKVTRADGLFHFMDLPDGDYVLTVSMPGSGTRFGTAQAGFRVARDAGGKIPLAAGVITLTATTLTGNVTGRGTPVMLAEVRILGSGERAFTDTRGNYTVAGLETGNRVLQVSAQGYKQQSQAVKLGPAGITQSLDIVLVAA